MTSVFGDPVKYKLAEAVAAFVVPSDNKTLPLTGLFIVLKPVPLAPEVPDEPEVPEEPF